MNFLKATISAITISLSSIAIAAPLSSTIPLDDLKIIPGGFAKITGEKLYTGVKYTINCNIKNEIHPDPNTMSFVQFHEASTIPEVITVSIPVRVDMEPAFYDKVTPIKSAGSRLEIFNFQSTDEFYIRNLDYTDTIAVTECIAMLETP